jgi:acyl-CoA thioesterase-1
MADTQHGLRHGRKRDIDGRSPPGLENPGGLMYGQGAAMRVPFPALRRLRPALAVLSLMLGGFARAAGPAPHTVVFFGDSLTAGYGLADPDTESYPARVQEKIDGAHLPWRVVNAGLSGETSAGGLRRVDWVLRQHPDVFVLALGANDGLRGTAPAVTESNLQGIIDHVRTRYPDTRIVIAGMRMPPSMGADFAAAYQAIFPDLAKKNGLVLIPFLLAGVAAVPDLNQGDGMHPTAAGARRVADGVWGVIAPLLAAGP